MREIVEIQLWQFALVYLLLLIVGAVMKKCHVNQLKLLVIASVRMSVQLALAGLVLTWIFQRPHPALTIAYIAAMTAFAIGRVLRKMPGLRRGFQAAIALSLALPGVAVLCFLVGIVVGQSVFDPQYMIPIGGMVIGNAMTGVSLGVNAFHESLSTQAGRVEALLNAGAQPRRILLPFAAGALETALLPTMNSMLGMGIVSLPGMMTGQILSGTLPATAILYQIAIMISICAAVCLSVFGALFFGMRSMLAPGGRILPMERAAKGA